MRWSIRFALAPREFRCRTSAVAARSNETHSCFRRSPPRSFAHRRSTRVGSLCRRLGIGQPSHSHRDSLGGSSPSRTGECCCGEAIARVTQPAGCGTDHLFLHGQHSRSRPQPAPRGLGLWHRIHPNQGPLPPRS